MPPGGADWTMLYFSAACVLIVLTILFVAVWKAGKK